MQNLSLLRKTLAIRNSVSHQLSGGVVAVAILAVGLFATPIRAGFVQATFSNVNPGEVVTITSQKYGTESGWAGVYNFTNATSDIGLSGNLKTFCIDISQNINSGNTVKFDVTNLADAPVQPADQMGQKRANLIGELWYQNYASIGTNNSNAAAFQIAIWEIINETTIDQNGDFVLYVSGVNKGTFNVQGNAETLKTANMWLSALDLTGNGTKTPGLIAMTSGGSSGYQDYVVQGPVATPVPSSLVLGMTGTLALLLPVAWRTRKRFSFKSSFVPKSTGSSA